MFLMPYICYVKCYLYSTYIIASIHESSVIHKHMCNVICHVYNVIHIARVQNPIQHPPFKKESIIRI